MVAIQDASVETDSAVEADAVENGAVETGAQAQPGAAEKVGAAQGRQPRSRWARVRLVTSVVALIVVSGLIGWLTPRVAAHYNRPSYLGKPASAVAKDLGCTDYKKAAKHDESVYKYRDQGTCVLDGTVVTITTFDRVADGETFGAVMRAVIPLLHPTWVGASYAAGDGWNVADARNLTAKVTELAVRRLGTGAVHVIPSAKAS